MNKHLVVACAACLVVSLGSAPLALAAADTIEKGVELYSSGKYQEAANLLELETEKGSAGKEAFLWLAYSRFKLGQWSGARGAFKKYAELAPDDSSGLAGAARCYAAEGNKDLAKLWYGRALEVDPSNESIKKELAAVDDPPVVDPPVKPETNPPKVEPETKDEGWPGLAGKCGARKGKTGKTIAVVIFVLMAISGIVQGGVMYSGMYGEMGGGVAFISALLGGVLWYFVYWGWPDVGSQYGWMVTYCVIMGIGTASVAASQ